MLRELRNTKQVEGDLQETIFLAKREGPYITLARLTDLMVSDIVLLQGSWFALEQAGRLLHASTDAFDNGDPSTALALAMLGREELGRSFLFRDLAKQVLAGKHFSVSDVKRRCDDHVHTQQAAALSTTLRITPPSKLADALQHKTLATRDTPKWQEANALVKVALDARRKRAPNDRHHLRMRSLYVDLNPEGLT